MKTGIISREDGPSTDKSVRAPAVAILVIERSLPIRSGNTVNAGTNVDSVIDEEEVRWER